MPSRTSPSSVRGSLTSETLFDYAKLDARRKEIERRMGEADFWNDAETAKKRVAELREAKLVCESLDGMGKGLDDAEALAELAAEANDAASDVEAEGMVAQVVERFEAFELRSFLSGPYDAGDAIVNFQAGAGGTDASDWAQMLLRMYSRFAEQLGFKTEILDVETAEEAGIKHAAMRVSGPYAYGYFVCEMGVHRLVRMSPFDAQNRRQTSFAAVDVAPDVEDDGAIVINDADVRVDTYRAGGKGGQHVNKTESAVRLTHLPTNIVVQCQTERSQHKNKESAYKMLKAKLLQQREMQRMAELKSMYDSKGQIAWGSQMRSYVLAPYQLVKDLRTDYDTGNVQRVLDGALMPFVDAYLRFRAKGKEKTGTP
jgi:peptide chain release factor 2